MIPGPRTADPPELSLMLPVFQGVPKLGSRQRVKQHLQTYQVDMMYRYASVHIHKIHKQENTQQASLRELPTPTIHV